MLVIKKTGIAFNEKELIKLGLMFPLDPGGQKTLPKSRIGGLTSITNYHKGMRE